MANVFIVLRDEKKSPDVNKRRQIPLQSLHDLKAFSSECDKNLMVIQSMHALSCCHSTHVRQKYPRVRLEMLILRTKQQDGGYGTFWNNKLT
jgi:hypothetical protein